MIKCTKVVELRDREEYFIKLDINETTKLSRYEWE
jgi:hypothetical protein